MNQSVVELPSTSPSLRSWFPAGGDSPFPVEPLCLPRRKITSAATTSSANNTSTKPSAGSATSSPLTTGTICLSHNHDTNMIPPQTKTRVKKTLFHFDDDQSSDSESESNKTNNDVKIRNTDTDAAGCFTNSLGLSVGLDRLAPPPSISSLPFPSRPSPDATIPSSPLSRTPSSPVILLANGKPLKPSLKSSFSSPNIPSLHHTRAQSEPASPFHASSGPTTPTVKNVHFAEQGALQSVRLFDRASKPANVSKPNLLADETETETEFESSANSASSTPAAGVNSVTSRFPPALDTTFDVDLPLSSPIPSPRPPLYANLHLEAIVLPPVKPLALKGSILVRNLSFAKDIAVRFTLDDWQTTSEVTCKYETSLSSLPVPFHEFISKTGELAASTPGFDSKLLRHYEDRLAWDRFSFSIRLEDFEKKLVDRTLWMAVRYSSPGLGEWWDNNDGQNYYIRFKTTAILQHHQWHRGFMAMQKINSSQQRTFSAPPMLKRTPLTGQFVPHHMEPNSSISSAGFPSMRCLLPRAHTSPHPIAGGIQTCDSQHPWYVTNSKKLSLTNYSAPTVVAPQTLTRYAQAELSTFAPADDPQYVIVVNRLKTDDVGKTLAPIAEALYESLFEGE